VKIQATQAIELAQLIGAKVIGSSQKLITGFNEIHRVNEGDLVFVDHPKYFKTALASKATDVIINQDVEFRIENVIL